MLRGPNINGLEGSSELRVENALKQAALWDEVADRLDDSALNLSGANNSDFASSSPGHGAGGYSDG